MAHDSVDEVVCPLGTTFMQYVGDNTDHDIVTVDGKNTHHGLGSIAIANGVFADINNQRRPLPRDRKKKWSEIVLNEGIQIKQYHSPDTTALEGTILKPVTRSCAVIHPRFIDLLWNCSYCFKSLSPSWSVYMSLVSSNQPLPTSVVTMLPIIDLHATDPTALYSLLCFISNQCSKLNVPTPPSVTFDQPLYVKAYDIVSSMNMNIIVRLGGFHQLMSYLGSIGCIMEGSGLRNALETVYAPITVGHMFTGKAYARALRGHFLASSALLTLLLETFWVDLSVEEKNHLTELYNSEDPSSKEDDELAVKIVSRFEEKKKTLASSSRRPALWLNYTQYVTIAQAFSPIKKIPLGSRQSASI